MGRGSDVKPHVFFYVCCPRQMGLFPPEPRQKPKEVIFTRAERRRKRLRLRERTRTSSFDSPPPKKKKIIRPLPQRNHQGKKFWNYSSKNLRRLSKNLRKKKYVFEEFEESFEKKKYVFEEFSLRSSRRFFERPSKNPTFEEDH